MNELKIADYRLKKQKGHTVHTHMHSHGTYTRVGTHREKNMEDGGGGVGGAEEDQGRVGLGVILLGDATVGECGRQATPDLLCPPSPLVSYFWV
jgi:secreted trypsin-like serine protease